MAQKKAWVSMFLQSRKAQLLLVNSLTCGLEVCLATAITYVPPLLLEAGVEERFMTMVLGIGPVLGLIFVPLIGSASDHLSSSYGRRRPFIWCLCMGVLLSLFLIPHAGRLANLFGGAANSMEITFLILGIGLLDFCGQVCFTPLEALLSDLFQDSDNCRQAFSMYAFMIGLGGCIGYLLPAIDWSQSFLAPYLGGQEECLFSLLILIFSGCVLATLFVSEEVVGVQVGLLDERASKELVKPMASSGRSSCCPCHFSLMPFRARHIALALRSFCTLVPRLRTLCCRVPKVMRRLFIAELCSWMALMTFMLFYTDFVGEGLYHGLPMALPGTEGRLHYDEGVRMGSVGLFLQSAVAIFFSTIMDRLVKRLGTREVYLSSMAVFSLAALVMCFSNSIAVVTVAAALTGFTFAALQIVPYTLASLYHHEKQVFFPKYKGIDEDIGQENQKAPLLKGLQSNSKTSYPNGHGPAILFSAPSASNLCVGSPCEASVMMTGLPEPDPVAPGRGVCLDFAILDSAFLLSQVVPSLVMGTIVQFTQSVTAYMVSATGLGFLSIYFIAKVVFEKSDMSKPPL
ncbi:solute carrier family 45 member 3 [Ambystoma mexicanum]|uniref:solute carrier family 45 member 3 n=1 Tax=Ambystoma mexicanum TaxID=8296 RepID=UPI0037E78DE8